MSVGQIGSIGGVRWLELLHEHEHHVLLLNDDLLVLKQKSLHHFLVAVATSVPFPLVDLESRNVGSHDDCLACISNISQAILE